MSDPGPSSRRSIFSVFSRSSGPRTPASAPALRPTPNAPELSLRPPRPPSEPDVAIHLPLHSIVLVSARPDGQTGEVRPTQTHVAGEVEVRLPQRRRVRGVRLVRRTWSRLELRRPEGAGERGRGRGEADWETDVIREKVMDLKGETVLDAGIHRFEFDDELEPTTPFTDTINERIPLVGTHYIVQVLGDMPEGPAPHPMVDLSELDSPPTYEPPPSDDVTDGASEALPLEQTFSSWRLVLVQHNPSPTGGMNVLDDRFNAFVDELGIVDGRCYSNEFMVAGPLVARIRIPTPSPKVTIFAIRLTLHQVERMTSSRDGYVRQLKAKEPFLLVGKLPPRSHRFPGKDIPALWRGSAAGGPSYNDRKGLTVESGGRFPIDMDIRYSTMPGVETPVVLSHQLEYEIFYSIQQQDADGSPLIGPGELRKVSRRTAIIMPSCCLRSELIELPQYPDSSKSGSTDRPTHYLSPDLACAVCGQPPSSRLCTACASSPSTSSDPTSGARHSSIPHIRHDAGPAFCAGCSGRNVWPRTLPVKGVWRCACMDWREARGQGKPGMEIPDDEAPLELLDAEAGVGPGAGGQGVGGEEGSGGGEGDAARARERWRGLEVVRGRERRDHMLAVKLDGEWRSKYSQRDDGHG